MSVMLWGYLNTFIPFNEEKQVFRQDKSRAKSSECTFAQNFKIKHNIATHETS